MNQHDKLATITIRRIRSAGEVERYYAVMTIENETPLGKKPFEYRADCDYADIPKSLNGNLARFKHASRNLLQECTNRFIANMKGKDIVD